jgi:hypothetical protein
VKEKLLKIFLRIVPVPANGTFTLQRKFAVVTQKMSYTFGQKCDFEGPFGFMNLILKTPLYLEVSNTLPFHHLLPYFHAT